MAQFVITSILSFLIAGAMLGQRFSALVLVPAGFLVVIAIAVIGTALAASFWAWDVVGVAQHHRPVLIAISDSMRPRPY